MSDTEQRPAEPAKADEFKKTSNWARPIAMARDSNVYAWLGFIGLICLVAICKLIGLVCSKLPDGKAEKTKAVPEETEIPNRQEFIAAVSAAIAEELGEDVSAIRITSVKRI